MNVKKNIWLLSTLAQSLLLQAEVCVIDFDVSMKTAHFAHTIVGERTVRCLQKTGAEVLQFFRALYARNNFDKVTRCASPRIPKIIHQIWIGSAVPKELRVFQESCVDFLI